jgi:hypothetical protein
VVINFFYRIKKGFIPQGESLVYDVHTRSAADPRATPYIPGLTKKPEPLNVKIGFIIFFFLIFSKFSF